MTLAWLPPCPLGGGGNVGEQANHTLGWAGMMNWGRGGSVCVCIKGMASILSVC